MTDDTTALAEAVVEAGTNAPLLPMARLWLLRSQIVEKLRADIQSHGHYYPANQDARELADAIDLM